jgi:hypothetical protein
MSQRSNFSRSHPLDFEYDAGLSFASCWLCGSSGDLTAGGSLLQILLIIVIISRKKGLIIKGIN